MIFNKWIEIIIEMFLIMKIIFNLDMVKVVH